MTVLFFRRTGHPFLTGCLALLTLGAIGCGGEKGDLSGTVSYNGKPVVLGSVLLIGADAKPRTAWIEADGTYHFDDVPAGEAKLAVFSPDPAKQDKSRKKQAELKKKRLEKDKSLPPEPDSPALPAVDRTKWFAVPALYSDIDHSGLHVTIIPGPNTYHLDMK